MSQVADSDIISDPGREEIDRMIAMADLVGLPIEPYSRAIALNRVATASQNAGIPPAALLDALGAEWMTDLTRSGVRKLYERDFSLEFLEMMAGFVVERLAHPNARDLDDGAEEDPGDSSEDPTAEAYHPPQPIWTYAKLAESTPKKLFHMAGDLATYYRVIHDPHLRAGRAPPIQTTYPFSRTFSPKLTAASIGARLRCPLFWARWLRKVADSSREYSAAIRAAADPHDPKGLGVLSGSPKISKRTYGILKKRQNLADALFSSINLVDLQTGETVCTLLDIRRSERARRQAAMNAVIQGMQDYATETGRVWVFLTLTLEGTWHATTTTGRRSSSWNKRSFEECHHELHAQWRKLSRALDRAKVDWYGLRVVEAHQDGTPHWHVQVYVKPEDLETLQALILQYYPDPETDPDARRRTRIVVEDKSRKDHASALTYITKYIRKSLDEPCPDSLKLRAHRTRAYQFFGLNGMLSFWQRVVSAAEHLRPTEPLGRALWDAAHPEKGERRTFLTWMRLIKDEGLRIRNIYEEAEKVGGYGDPITRAIGARVTTKDGAEWVFNYPQQSRFILMKENGTPFQSTRAAQLWLVIQEGQNPGDPEHFDDLEVLFEDVSEGVSVSDWVLPEPEPGPHHENTLPPISKTIPNPTRTDTRRPAGLHMPPPRERGRDSRGRVGG